MAAGFDGMGIGRLGDPSRIFKRKFRFTFEIAIPCPITTFGSVTGSNGSTIPEWFVKTVARPQLDIEETELNFLNAVTWIPGKGKWQPITVTYIDVADSLHQPLYNWLASVYDFTDPVRLKQTEKAGWAATGTLRMFDGCGTLIETWTLKNMWPQSVNFGDLDYANSEEATIELSLRYSDVTYTPNGKCGLKPPQPCCEGC